MVFMVARPGVGYGLGSLSAGGKVILMVCPVEQMGRSLPDA